MPSPTPPKRSDEELLHASIKAPSQFSELVERYQEPFLRKARRIVGEREEAHDIVQDAFTKIYLNAGRFREVEGGSFRAWGYKILVNTALTHYQKFKKEHERYVHVEPELMETLPEKESTAAMNESFFEEEIVFVCSRMPRALARVFRSYFLGGESHNDIAKKEGITHAAAKTKISRAKKEFKKIYLESHAPPVVE